ncbi:HrpE/YscL family type III secretion apparatus protein [Burkholderia pyrrocinia]|uniref:Type 3 secretion system stator protein n=1 Tax=Burkholderia pyrrocinia TaxID=60550 RepID=A0A2Z5NBZ8_BURPY|nr:type III secretion system stator protein SctL [Burkholderia pyrrocinia]AXF25787.1 HrpE/YscL family type III secretion apparatus protein [Burkholderia pyrrocinia]
MVVWLRSDEGGVGVDGDVIRREAFSTLVELDDAYARMRDECERMLRDARDEATGIVAAARDEMAALAHGAQLKFERSARLGYAAGRRRALDEWNARVVQAACDERDALANANARLADVLMRACEHVVRIDAHDAFYAKIAHALDRSISDATFLRIDVHPDDAEAARAAFDHAAHALGWTLPVEIVCEPRMDPGGCVCEWDAGVLECSLSEQLASVRRALQRVLSAAHAGPDAEQPA